MASEKSQPSGLPRTYSKPISLGIIGGTGLGSLPSPPFHPVAEIPPIETPWGFPSSALTILEYRPEGVAATSTNAIVIAFLARHGPTHAIAPHEINNRANVAALKHLGVHTVIGFSAVGSLQEDVRPRDFCIAGSVVDWTKGVRPWTFFEQGVVGHVSMAQPFDSALSGFLGRVLKTDGVLEGSEAQPVTVHEGVTVICIEGPQFATRAESCMFRSLQAEPRISCINMSAVPECKLFREAEMAYALVCMSTDYDSWRESEEAVSVEMVMAHMKVNGENARRGIVAVLDALARETKDGQTGLLDAQTLKGQSRNCVMGIKGADPEAVKHLSWLFGKDWVENGH